MKKLIVLLTAISLFATATGCQANITPTASSTPPAVSVEVKKGGNFTEEMKIERKADISPVDGADSIERQGDHKDSPYFSNLDFYNMTSSDTLTIIPQFKTIQQSSEWSCGVTSAMMVLNHYGKLGEYNEKTLAELRPNGLTPEGTSLRQTIAVFEGVGGFEITSTLNYDMETFSLETIVNYLDAGVPVMVAWNDWGGHWQVIIGYDNMGTEATNDDVLIMADPYDTTDHNQDGYTVYGAERFYYNFTMYDFFPEEELNDQLFIAVRPL